MNNKNNLQNEEFDNIIGGTFIGDACFYGNENINETCIGNCTYCAEDGTRYHCEVLNQYFQLNK